MPYRSKKQQRKFHAMEARGEISHKTVAEFDHATNFKTLPESVKALQRKGRSGRR